MSCAGYRANGVNSNQTAAITDRSREKEMNIHILQAAASSDP